MAIQRKRPAETAGAVAGSGGIIAALLAHNWLAVGLAALAYVPAVATFVVAHGGVHGVLRTVWGGRS